MSKVMLVNVTHVEESRVAILENGVLADYEIETTSRATLKGNVHNAIVESVHATLEAAFVRLGPDLKGFLPLDEVNFKLLPARGERGKNGRIGQHLHPGQKLMAQVVREPFSGKPPSVSTYFSLPGRYLVLMPGVDSAGVSRKIDDASQRERLRQLVEELEPPEGFGLIVRTAGLGVSKTELQRDLRYLLRLWESVQRGSRSGEFPSMVYREADLVIRTMRDFLTSDVDEVWIDGKEMYEKALAFVGDVMPTRAKILKLYAGDRPLFNKFNLEEQIENIYKRRVPLPSGGEIVIDGTEALTAIDVNSARTKRHGDVDETNTLTNLEAAAEIARQLRLRDLGGLIVCDFIDMESARNRKRVEKAMKDAMRGDRARCDVTSISKLGLMELARQRIKGAKLDAVYMTCPSCDGYGWIKTVEGAALSALRKLQTRSARGGLSSIRLGLPPEVATWLLNNKREELLRVERRNDLTLEVLPRLGMRRHETEFEVHARERSEAPIPLPPEPPETKPEPVAVTPPPAPVAPVVVQSVAKSAKLSIDFDDEPDDEGEDQPEEQVAEGAELPEGQTAAADNGNGDPNGALPGGEQGGRRRRRRRRRRRGRGRPGEPRPEGVAAQPNGHGGEEQPAAPTASVPPREEPSWEPVVPTGVRSDELMPAASGGQGGRRSGRRGRGRRGRGGGQAGPGPSG
jgi:ribonuclease E